MKKIYLSIGTLLLASMSFSQAPFMENNFSYQPTEKYAPGAISTIDGRQMNTDADRAIYYSENFDDGFGGWEATIQTGPVGFKLTSTGHENDPANTFQIPVLTTSTPTQWVLVDSDGDNSSYAIAEATTLTSPELDLTAAAGTFVALQFEQFFAEWQPAETSDHCYIAISTDSLIWTEIEINEGAGREARPNPEYISWDITDIIAGEESSVWIRFRWEGAWNYGWQIDNVSIENINESDLAIVDTYRMYNDGIVYSKLAQAHTQEFNIGAIIKNIGHIEQTNIGFDWTIKDPSGAVAASGTSETISSLLNGEQDTLIIATGYTPTDLGFYTVEWTAFGDDADDETTDNIRSDDYFELTEYTMALDYSGGPIIETTNWPLKVGLAYFGNLMTFQGDDVATALLVKLADHSENAGEIIGGAVWEFPEGGVAWNLIYTTDDYEIRPADIGNFVTFDLDEFFVNSTSTYVFCSFLYSNGPQPIFERQGDIGFNNVQGFDDEFLSRGFFDRSAPIVRVRLNEGEVSLDENETPNFLSVFPNPATDAITVRFSTRESTPTTVNVLDITGQIIRTVNLGTTTGEQQFQLDLTNLTTGIYFIEMVNDQGTQIKKFVKK